MWSSESSVNLYPDAQDSGRSPTANLPWPGEKSWRTLGDANRGIKKMGGVLYQVAGNTLYSIDINGSATSIGTISGSGRVMFAQDGTNLVIRTFSGATYQYDGEILTQNTSSNLAAGKTLAHINKQILYQGQGAQFTVSNAGDPSTINAANIGTVESVGDDLVQIAAFKERAYMGGTDSIETWYNSGTGSPPFQEYGNSVFNTGVASPYSMASTPNYLYFLGTDGTVYRTPSYQPQSITPSAIAKEIREDGGKDNAVGIATAKIDAQNYYILQLNNVTLAYSEPLNVWIRLATGLNLDKHLIHSYEYCYGQHIVADSRNGNLYQWDFDTYTSAGSPLVRQRDSMIIDSQLVGAPNKRLTMSKVEILMETGVGQASAMVSASFDGGNSFTNESWIDLGNTGDKIRKVEYYKMASFYQAIIRVRVSAPNFVGIHGGNITMRASGQ